MAACHLVLAVFAAISLVSCSDLVKVMEANLEPAEEPYCSFFQNRAPTPQPNLKNCTWYSKKSCCLQQEIDTSFATMKPLIGSSPECLLYINYLMCYICAPSQNTFYMGRNLTVCKEFCDRLYSACQFATLKGSIIGKSYSNGTEFCTRRRFLVSTDSTKCFSHTGPVTVSHANMLTIHSGLLVFILSAAKLKLLAQYF